MAATSDEEMDSLLSTFDQIYQDFKTGVAEIQLVKSASNAEAKKREALEFTCNNLKQENLRLTRLYTESLNNLADQLERRTSCQSLKEELQRMTVECLSKHEEHSKAMELLNKDYAYKVHDLEAQIRGFMLEKTTNEAAISHLPPDLAAVKSHMQVLDLKDGLAIEQREKNELNRKIQDLEKGCERFVLEKETNEATINHLRQDLAAHKSHMQILASRLEQVHFDVESKYILEIQDLKDCLAIEQEEKSDLNRKIQDLEKELLVSRSTLVEQQRDLNSVWHAETLKSKIMKLRKENEILKRKLLHSGDG